MSLQELLAYIRVLQKRWWVFVILCGTTVAGMLISFYTAPTQYKASVRLLVNAPPSFEVSLYRGLSQPTQLQQIAVVEAAFMEIVQSPTVVWNVVDTLQVSMRADELTEQLTAEKPVKSEFIWVTVQAGDPQEAANLANTVVDMAKNYYGQLLARPSASAREFVSLQIEAALQELEVARQALADFKRENNFDDLEAEIESQRHILWNLILKRDDALISERIEWLPSYEQIIAQHEEELRRLSILSDEYKVLEGDIERAEVQYRFLRDKETEAKLKEDEIERVGFILVVEPARPPQRPVSPFNVKIFAVGVIASLLLSFVIAFVMEYIESGKLKEASAEIPINDSRQEQ